MITYLYFWKNGAGSNNLLQSSLPSNILETISKPTNKTNEGKYFQCMKRKNENKRQNLFLFTSNSTFINLLKTLRKKSSML